MPQQRFLVCVDLDGTVLGDGAGESAFRLWAQARQGRVVLAYNTGRGIDSVRELIAQGRLPEADYAATAVGTEVWDLRDPQNRLGRHYRDLADPAWPAQRLRELGESPETPLQGPEGQGRFKSSFYWNGRDAALDAFCRRLSVHTDWRLVTTAGMYLDVLPRCFGKGQALRFLAAAAGVEMKRVVAAGDMEHDEEMLRAAGHAIVPANALPSLKAALQDSAAFFAEGREGLGLMEGLRRVGLA